ncbi:unnamed protein product, partial [Didymodactylos carnosus]
PLPSVESQATDMTIQSATVTQEQGKKRRRSAGDKFLVVVLLFIFHGSCSGTCGKFTGDDLVKVQFSLVLSVGGRRFIIKLSNPTVVNIGSQVNCHATLAERSHCRYSDRYELPSVTA